MIAQKTIRMAPDVDEKVTIIDDLNSAEPIFFHRGNDVRFDISPFRNKVLLIPNGGSVYLEIKINAQAAEVPIVSTKTTAFNSISLDEWQSGKDVLSIVLLNADTLKIPAGKQRLTLWWSESGRDLTLYSGLIEVKKTAAENRQGNHYAIDHFEKLSAKGMANGYAPLASNGRLDSRFLPESIKISGDYLGGISGEALPDAAPNKGDWYFITAEGTSQNNSWLIGDKAVYEGHSQKWTRIPIALGGAQLNANTKSELADLNANDYPHGQLLQLKGYHAIDDGGGGLFWLDKSGLLGSTAANKGTIFLATDSVDEYWRRLNALCPTPEMFGAYGNWHNEGDYTATVDDTQAFQDALDYLADSQGTLHLQSGKTYRIRSSLKVYAGITLISSGSTKPQIHFEPSTESDLFEIEANANNDPLKTRTLHLSGLTLLGGVYARHAIVAKQLDSASLRGVYFSGFKGCGFKGSALQQASFNECQFEACDCGIQVGEEHNTTSPSTVIIIKDCRFEGNHLHPIDLNHCKYVKIENSVFLKNNQQAAYPYSESKASCIHSLNCHLFVEGALAEQNYCDFLHASSSDGSHMLSLSNSTFKGPTLPYSFDLAKVDKLELLEVGPCSAENIEFSALVRVVAVAPKMVRYTGFRDKADWQVQTERENAEAVLIGDKRRTGASGNYAYWLCVQSGISATQQPSMLADDDGYVVDGTLKWRQVGRFLRLDTANLVDYSNGGEIQASQFSVGDQWQLKQGSARNPDELFLGNAKLGSCLAIHPQNGFMAFNKSAEQYSEDYKHDFGGNLLVRNHDKTQAIADFHDDEGKSTFRLANDGAFEFGNDPDTQLMPFGANTRGALINGVRLIEAQTEVNIDLSNQHPSGIPFSGFLLLSVIRKWTATEKYYDTAIYLMGPDRISGPIGRIERARPNYEVRWDGNFLKVINHHNEKIGVNLGILAVANCL